MKTLLNNARIGSFHMRKRVKASRYGIGKGEMSYMLHIGKRSFYFYPATCLRPIKPNDVFF